MRRNEILKLMGVKDRPVPSVIGKPEPIAHPKNCRTECPYGHGKAYCFPCMKKILAEQNAGKKAEQQEV